MAKSRKRSDSSVAGQSPSESQQRSNGDQERLYDRDRVARRADELYLARGGSHGADWEDWLAAERELMNAQPGQRNRGDKESR